MINQTQYNVSLVWFTDDSSTDYIRVLFDRFNSDPNITFLITPTVIPTPAVASEKAFNGVKTMLSPNTRSNNLYGPSFLFGNLMDYMILHSMLQCK